MSKESTLKLVEQNILQGDLGKARDRLHGLICSYPDDLILRCNLAEVYWILQYPQKAGCYWYLEENQSEDSRQAVELFEKRYGNDPWLIWHALKFRGNKQSISAFAQEKLNNLIEECKLKHGTYPEFKEGNTEWKTTTRRKVRDYASLIGAISFLGFIGFVALAGLVSIIKWLL